MGVNPSLLILLTCLPVSLRWHYPVQVIRVAAFAVVSRVPLNMSGWIKFRTC